MELCVISIPISYTFSYAPNHNLALAVRFGACVDKIQTENNGLNHYFC